MSLFLASSRAPLEARWHTQAVLRLFINIFVKRARGAAAMESILLLAAPRARLYMINILRLQRHPSAVNILAQRERQSNTRDKACKK